MKKKSKKKWLWLILLAVMILGGAYLANSFLTARALRTQVISYSTQVISTGSVKVSVTGSGKLVPAETDTIDIPDGLTVDQVLVQTGDLVNAGDRLATFDVNSLRDKAAVLSDELSTLDKQLDGLNDEKTTNYIYAPVAGRIKYIPVKLNAEVTGSITKYGALALLSTDGKMRLDIQTTAKLKLHSNVTVKSGSLKKTGEVVAQIPTGYTITLSDFETVYGKTAKVYQSDKLIGEGVLQINQPIAVYANGGTLAKIYHAENIRVTTDSKLFALDNEPLTSTYQQTYSNRSAKAQELQTVLGYLEAPYVTATTKGTIGEVLISATGTSSATSAGASTTTGSATTSGSSNTGNAAAGSQAPTASATTSASDATTGKTQSTSSGNTGTVKAFVINRDGALQMTIAADELDIGSIALGQTAKITLDAMAREAFGAKVTRIAYIGQAKSNITTYDVELTLDPDQRFLTGMNGNATITAKQVDNVLLVPIEAMSEDESGTYVFVSPGGRSDGQDRIRKTITTGLSDGEFAEVTSGLSKGDMVLYVKPGAATPTQSVFPGGVRPPGLSGGFNREGSTGGTRSGN